MAGLGRQFNEESLRTDWLLDAEYGVCPPVIPDGRPRRYPSLPRWLAGHRQRRDLLGEQIRLLYVACTRAAERLLLVASCRESRLATWSEPGGSIPTRSLLEARSPVDWIGPLLPSLAGADDFPTRDSGRSGLLDWQVWRSVPPPAPAEPASPDRGEPVVGQLSFDLIATSGENIQNAREAGRRLHWKYPWPAATREAAKAAVTALRQRWMADEETAPPTPETPPHVGNPGTPPAHRHPPKEEGSTREHRPDGDPSASRQSAIERGLTHHLFNERVDLARTGTLDELVAEANRLESLGWLSPEDRRSLDFEGLTGFWMSPLAETLRTEARHVERELPFTASLRVDDARRLGNPQSPRGFSPDDYQVIQGVIDLALIRPDEIWIVDFKTDRVAPGEVAARATAYGPQLRIYADALSRVFQRPVTRLWLYFFATRELIPVDDPGTNPLVP